MGYESNWFLELEIFGMYLDLTKYFGEDFVKQEDIQDLFRQFYSDKVIFYQFYDLIRSEIEKNSEELEEIYGNQRDEKAHIGSV